MRLSSVMKSPLPKMPDRVNQGMRQDMDACLETGVPRRAWLALRLPSHVPSGWDGVIPRLGRVSGKDLESVCISSRRRATVTDTRTEEDHSAFDHILVMAVQIKRHRLPESDRLDHGCEPAGRIQCDRSWQRTLQSDPRLTAWIAESISRATSSYCVNTQTTGMFGTVRSGACPETSAIRAFLRCICSVG